MDRKQHDRYVPLSSSFLAYREHFASTAGAGAGLIASIVICPLDAVKTKLQAQRAVHGQLGYQALLVCACPTSFRLDVTYRSRVHTFCQISSRLL